MLTRLKVSGFKNLVDVEVRFGPFTCIAGANGSGKSNLFDAIRLLSALADRPLTDAARSVRDEGGRSADVRSLFHRMGERYGRQMSFEADMIVPREGVDDLGQEARASTTFLQYRLTLAYRAGDGLESVGPLELLSESLAHINLKEAPRALFPHSVAWRKSALSGRRTSPFISTEESGSGNLIKLHQDGRHGRPLTRSAASLPRTVLSVVNAAESPTALLARREMQSWRLLQLEPSALRQPDEFTAPTRLGADGSHLPAALYRLARSGGPDRIAADPEGVYSGIANRLSELIDDVHELRIDRDERRELLTLSVVDRGGTAHPARALSGGTLRFLALAVMEYDPTGTGVLCLEEPENGIHPERIPAVLTLLTDLATDADYPVGPDNPFRQVIVNTHSPALVAQVPDDSLLVAHLVNGEAEGVLFSKARFSPLPDTWRTEKPGSADPVARGELMAYLNPTAPSSWTQEGDGRRHPRIRTRVAERPDLQMMLPFGR